MFGRGGSYLPAFIPSVAKMRQRGRAPVRWWQRRKALTEGLAGGNDKNVLLLGGHTLGLTPPGIELYALATDFYGFIGAYPHIILLLRGQLTDTLRSRLIFAHRHRLSFLKLAAGTVLHLIAGSLSPLLFPGDLKAFLGSFHLRHAGAFWIDIVGQALCAAGGTHCTGGLPQGECGLHLRAQGRQKLSHGNKG